MSMFTNISDLPQSKDIEESYEDANTNANVNTNIDIDIERNHNKKKVRFLESFENENSYSVVNEIINEENILLLIILFLTALPITTGYINNIPLLNAYITNDFMGSIVKSIVMLVLYIICKLFIIPQLKL